MSISEKMGTFAKAAQQRISLLTGTTQIAQAAAVCYREADGMRLVLVISSRKSGKFGLPKGNIDPGETSAIAAAREAYEEAGVMGIASDTVLSTFSYHKEGRRIRRHVAVHPLKVSATTPHFPEAGERALEWLPLAAAADRVSEPALKALLGDIADGTIVLS